MRLHLITIGKPKLDFAQTGWQEYTQRLKHYHPLRITQIPDKHDNAAHILQAAGSAYMVALVIEGQQFSSHDLAHFLDKQAIESQEVCFMIGGPEGLPEAVIKQADLGWSLSALTFPHDIAMVLLAEALYRASTISSGVPYHK